ncbi:MAG: hypothetical protein DI543_01640 [Bradyrhizobium icense]|nr:MAG: hypothetical protein DI543_01640 [Bradyrhizobium icense]
MLAALISLALALSFLHGASADADDGISSVASAQISSDGSANDSGKSAPDWGAPHGDHCLAHVTTVSPQDNAAPVEYVTRAPRLAAVLVPKSADLAAPFKPPRA